MALFADVAEEYDAGRPTYPGAVFDALGSIADLIVVDVGAGTGLATRPLIERGALVVGIDIEPRLLTRAVARVPVLRAVIADGVRLPIRTGSVDLVCCAQSWHWLDPSLRTTEMARALCSGGRWAGWWSHARADDEPWFEDYWNVIERACGGTNANQRDTDWGATLAADASFTVDDRVTIPWRRRATVEDWMLDQASHSYIAALPPDQRQAVLTELRHVVAQRFPDGTVDVPYETWLWIATKVSE